jgi:hypothetical protein
MNLPVATRAYCSIRDLAALFIEFFKRPQYGKLSIPAAGMAGATTSQSKSQVFLCRGYLQLPPARVSTLTPTDDQIAFWRLLTDSMGGAFGERRALTSRIGGCGRVHRWGGPVEEIRPGYVVWIPPAEKHWHGAAPSTAMSHIAIQEQLDGKAADWMEHVSDEQYNG